MNWQSEIVAEFSRLGKAADAAVIEEMAQHAEAAYEAARADGASTADAEAAVQALLESWCGATTGPRRIERAPILDAAPAGRTAPLTVRARTWASDARRDTIHGVRLLRQNPV